MHHVHVMVFYCALWLKVNPYNIFQTVNSDTLDAFKKKKHPSASGRISVKTFPWMLLSFSGAVTISKKLSVFFCSTASCEVDQVYSALCAATARSQCSFSWIWLKKRIEWHNLGSLFALKACVLDKWKYIQGSELKLVSPTHQPALCCALIVCWILGWSGHGQMSPAGPVLLTLCLFLMSQPV